MKLLGQIAAAVIAVEAGAVVTDVTLPFVGALQFPNTGGVITVVWLVGMMNVVNFSDGVDGLAAGVCAIDGIAFAMIAFDLGRAAPPAVLAALTAGAALGFLFHNFHPASVFMGDSGANLLGYLLGVAAVIGSLKTNAVVALVVPLFILAVPFLDTGFVVAKRLKYRRKPVDGRRQPLPPPHGADRVQPAQDGRLPVRVDGAAGRLAWPCAGPYRHAALRLGWVAVMADRVTACGQRVPVYVLEIFKFKAWADRAGAPIPTPASTRSTSRCARHRDRRVRACDSGARWRRPTSRN